MGILWLSDCKHIHIRVFHSKFSYVLYNHAMCWLALQISKDSSLGFDPTCAYIFELENLSSQAPPKGKVAQYTYNLQYYYGYSIQYTYTCTMLMLIKCKKICSNSNNCVCILVRVHKMEASTSFCYGIVYSFLRRVCTLRRGCVLELYMAEQESWVWTCRPRPGSNNHQVVWATTYMT